MDGRMIKDTVCAEIQGERREMVVTIMIIITRKKERGVKFEAKE